MSIDLPALPFAKGHGTQNDFVLIPDADGAWEPTPRQVALLCDRRVGIGGDGLIRVVRTAALPDAGPSLGIRTGEDEGVEWFMDYRNADGNTAEMCGNGLRVFVAYLEYLGHLRLGDGEVVAVGTRAGVKRVRRDGDLFAADLGPWRVVGGADAARAGHDARVWVAGEPAHLPGLRIDVGNPHAVVALPDTGRLTAADLSRPPVVEPVPRNGTNVELTVPLHDSAATLGHLAMRVHERGVGETRSCGTGAVAAALAARVWGGDAAPDLWRVDVPGGSLRVSAPAGDRLSGESVELAGPAVIVADGCVLTAAPEAAIEAAGAFL
ncbi:MAG TPA: diaminopimelate epimerase [Kineosporiaceae bacterium]